MATLIGLAWTGAISAAKAEPMCAGAHPRRVAGLAITVAPSEAGGGQCVFVPSERPANLAPAEAGGAKPQVGTGPRKVVYLDFDGEQVSVFATDFDRFDDDGIVIVPPFAESLARAYPTLDPTATRAQIVAQVAREYMPFHVLVTDNLATAVVEGNGRFERIYVGGNANIFARPQGVISSVTLGIAEVDPDNVNDSNIGFLLVENYPAFLSDASLAGPLMGSVASHEAGHEFGLEHIQNESGRMFARVTLNAAEVNKTWQAGLVNDAPREYQDSNLSLGRNVSLSPDPYPADSTPDDYPDHYFGALAGGEIDDPTVSGPVTVSGRIDGFGDVDVVRFTAARAGTVTAMLVPASFLTGVMAVVDEDGVGLDAIGSVLFGDIVELVFPTVENRVYFIYLNGRNGTNQGNYDLILCATSADPPRVADAVVNAGDVQRSRVTQLAVVFDAEVDVDLNAASLVHLGRDPPNDPQTMVDLATATLSYVPEERRLTIDFDASLVDGFYDLQLAADGVSNCAGTTLDGDGDGIAGGDFAFRFHRLAGDSDGDADVDLDDFAVFRDCFSGPGVAPPAACCSGPPEGGLCASPVDLDADDDVDLIDFDLFLKNYDGPRADCDENASLDLREILLDPGRDVDRNLILDSCEVIVIEPALVSIMEGLGSAVDTFISPLGEHVVFDSFTLEANDDLTLDSATVAYTGEGPIPAVSELRAEGAGRHTVLLDPPPAPGEWLKLTLHVTGSTGGSGDLVMWVAHLPDDVNQDGQINIRDATAFGDVFRASQATQLIDIDGNAQVDIRDATAFGDQWVGNAPATRPWGRSELPQRPE